jgi:hypothetical protein
MTVSLATRAFAAAIIAAAAKADLMIREIVSSREIN